MDRTMDRMMDRTTERWTGRQNDRQIEQWIEQWTERRKEGWMDGLFSSMRKTVHFKCVYLLKVNFYQLTVLINGLKANRHRQNSDLDFTGSLSCVQPTRQC